MFGNKLTQDQLSFHISELKSLENELFEITNLDYKHDKDVAYRYEHLQELIKKKAKLIKKNLPLQHYVSHDSTQKELYQTNEEDEVKLIELLRQKSGLFDNRVTLEIVIPSKANIKLNFNISSEINLQKYSSAMQNFLEQIIPNARLEVQEETHGFHPNLYMIVNRKYLDELIAKLDKYPYPTDLQKVMSEKPEPIKHTIIMC